MGRDRCACEGTGQGVHSLLLCHRQTPKWLDTQATRQILLPSPRVTSVLSLVPRDFKRSAVAFNASSAPLLDGKSGSLCASSSTTILLQQHQHHFLATGFFHLFVFYLSSFSCREKAIPGERNQADERWSVARAQIHSGAAQLTPLTRHASFHDPETGSTVEGEQLQADILPAGKADDTTRAAPPRGGGAAD